MERNTWESGVMRKCEDCGAIFTTQEAFLHHQEVWISIKSSPHFEAEVKKQVVTPQRGWWDGELGDWGG